MTVKEFYDSIGGGYEDALGRFALEKLIVKFLAKFPADSSFEDLKKAATGGECSKIFAAAHSLKGVCGNLAFKELYEVCREFCDELRVGDSSNTESYVKIIEEKYEKIILGISQLC